MDLVDKTFAIITTILFAAIVAVSIVAVGYSIKANQEIVTSNNIVLITGTFNGEKVSGTGTVVSSGSVLTARHVVEGLKDITVTFLDGTGRTARVSWKSSDMDAAVLSVAVPSTVKSAGIYCKEPEWGQRIEAIGFPFGLDYILTAGIVSSFKEIPKKLFGTEGMVFADINLQHGMSGGPIMDEDSRLIGIVTGGLTYGSDVPIINAFTKTAAFCADLPKGLVQ